MSSPISSETRSRSKRIVLAVALVLLLPTVVSAQFARIAGEVEIPVPEGWYLSTDTLSFPAQLLYQTDSAEILLFRSEITSGETVTNREELKGSVDLVIDEVISTLPDGQLLTSTGFYDVYLAGFVLEFTSTDSASSIQLAHRLKGIIYRHPDGHQLLFTIWGKCARADYAGMKEAFAFVQDGFVYTGEREAEVFGEKAMTFWPIVLLLAALLGLMLLRPRKNTPAA